MLAAMALDLTPDELVARTRSVRRRLDLTRPVEREAAELLGIPSDQVMQAALTPAPAAPLDLPSPWPFSCEDVAQRMGDCPGALPSHGSGHRFESCHAHQQD